MDGLIVGSVDGEGNSGRGKVPIRIANGVTKRVANALSCIKRLGCGVGDVSVCTCGR